MPTEIPELAGFEPAIRTLWLEVEDLSAHRTWSDPGGHSFSLEPPSTEGPDLYLRGVATSEDAVTLIGSEGKITTEFALTLRPYANAEELGDWWERLSALERRGGATATSLGDEGSRLSHLFARCYEAFEDRPPTCSAWFQKADWETGIEAEWLMDCRIPQEIFDSLRNDLADGSLQKAVLGVKFTPFLTNDRYAPPSVKIKVGIADVPEYGSGVARGWLSSLNWDLAWAPSRRHPTPASTQLPREEPDTKDWLPEPMTPVSVSDREVATLAATVRGGFFLVLILIALVAILT